MLLNLTKKFSELNINSKKRKRIGDYNKNPKRKIRKINHNIKFILIENFFEKKLNHNYL